jgi:hypothetical protein
MSQENIEVHHRLRAAMNTGGLSDELADALLAPGFRVEEVTSTLPGPALQRVY